MSSSEDSDSEYSGVQSLGRTPQKLRTKCHLEITLTLPPVQRVRNLISTKQRSYLCERWNLLLVLCKSCQIQFDHQYEFHKNGHIHLHGFIVYEMIGNFSPYGLISDIVKLYLQSLPKKYSNYNDNCLHHEYYRYKSPQICVQYINHDEKPERLAEWITYIEKDQV